MKAAARKSRRKRYLIFYTCSHCKRSDIRLFFSVRDFENNSLVQNACCMLCFIENKPSINNKLPLIIWGNIPVAKMQYSKLLEITPGRPEGETLYLTILGHFMMSGKMPGNIFALELTMDGNVK